MSKQSIFDPSILSARRTWTPYVAAFAAASLVAWAGCSGDTTSTNPTSGSGSSSASSSSSGAGGAGGAGAACGPNVTLCGEACVDTAVDPSNCGACGSACPAGQVCVAGSCSLVCAGGATKCGDACVNTANDPLNCGACGSACAAGTVCSGGACGVECLGGSAKCGDLCVDMKNDPLNCGACGAACAVGELCQAGMCGIECAAGGVKCGNVCVDTKNDPANCGACGSACAAGQVCAGGSCGLTCLGGSTKCGNVCADIQNDPLNCGACGGACAAGQVCAGGQCGFTCLGGATKCGSACVDIKNDPLNCGACANACNGSNGTPICVGGACAAPICDAGFANCDNDASNGCETATATDVSNCGACGDTCVAANGTPVCANGACAAPICDAGFGNCDNNVSNGCETPTAQNPAACGGCGNICVAANGTPVCANGACAAPICNSGFGNCDNDPQNGCEVDLGTSAANCGSCGNACVGVGCAAGSCGVALVNQFPYNGYYYATLDDAPPDAQYGTWINNCQTSFVTLPAGWSLVPEDPAIVLNVIAPHIWSTHCILFSNGVSYGVLTYNNGAGCGCSGNQCMLQNGDQYQVTSCSRRILIRRPM